MTIHAASSRPRGKTPGGAGLGAVVQLVVFVAVVVTFLAAPLLALAASYLVYTVMRSRGESSRTRGEAPLSTAGFGSGA